MLIVALDESSAQSLINALQVLEVLTATVHHDLKEKVRIFMDVDQIFSS